MASQLYNLHIKLYVIENKKDYYYKLLAEIGEENAPNDINVLFTNNNHYSLIISNQSQINNNNIKKIINKDKIDNSKTYS